MGYAGVIAIAIKIYTDILDDRVSERPGTVCGAKSQMQEIYENNPGVVGMPGPATLVVGRGSYADAAKVGAPCIDPSYVYSPNGSAPEGDGTDKVQDSMWSATKLITGLVLARMVDDPNVALPHFDMPMSSIFPEFWSNDKETDPRANITVKHIMAQIAGFSDHGCTSDQSADHDLHECARLLYENSYGNWDLECNGPSCANPDGINTIQTDPKYSYLRYKGTCPTQGSKQGLECYPTFIATVADSYRGPNRATLPDAALCRDPTAKECTVKPGDYFWYSNGNFQFLGAVIEKLTKMSYTAAVKHHLADPLEIKAERPGQDALTGHNPLQEPFFLSLKSVLYGLSSYQ